jgi:hydrogenase expression/formation protein HypE
MTKPIETLSASCPLPVSKHETIQLAHGSGGRLTDELIRKLFAHYFNNDMLNTLDDQATLEISGNRLTFSTDSYVVDPIFFPGGDIGDLAVNGTVNDLCMNGARPLYLSAGFILEEGLPLVDLERVVQSMQKAAEQAGVQIVTGDTKVVNRGKGDKIFINTAGIGVIEHDYTIRASNVQPHDIILISGDIASHGMAILSKREGLAFESPIQSDTAALNGLVQNMVQHAGEGIHAMRDATRGGIAAVLNEFAVASGVQIQLQEDTIPLERAVSGACELLGIDPLYVANEGRMVVAVAPEFALRLLNVMQKHPLGTGSVRVGEVTNRNKTGLVTLRTRLGAERIVDMPVGEQLPRIC